MVGMRRIVMAVALALTSLGSIAAVSVATATPSAAATCTIDWATGSSGNWSSPGNWLPARVPTSSDVACIYASGTYTVDMTGSETVGAVQISDGASGTQTLKVDGSSTNVNLSVGAASTVGSTGVLALNPNSSGGYADISGAGGVTVTSGGVLSTSFTGTGDVPAYIETPLTNQAGGTVTIGAPDTRQDSNTLTTNSGTFSVASGGNLAVTGGSSFTNTAGTLTLTGTMTETNGTFTQSGASDSGNAVNVIDVTLADSAGTGSFDDIGSGSTLTGTIPVGQTVTVDGRTTNVSLAVTGVTDDGTLALSSNSSGGYAQITGSGSGLTVASGGVLSTSLASVSSVPVYIETPLTNQVGGIVTISAPDTRQDSNTLTTNSGAFTVASGGNLSVTGGSSFTNTGTLTLTGTMTETGGTFTQSSTESGHPVNVNDVTLADSAGTGSFDDIGSGSTLTGTIPVGQTVTVDGRTTNVSLTVTGVTDDGTLALSSNSSGGYADVVGSGSGLTVASGGVLTTSFTGTGDVPAYIETPVTNQAGGAVTIAAPDTRQDSNTLTTNSGTFTVASGGNLAITGGGSFTDAAGTLTLTGTMTETGGTFTQSGATESGNAVNVNDVTLADSAGTGSFDDIGSGSTLTGTIPVGQTVTVDGRVTNVILQVTGVTDHGTLALTSNSAGGYADIEGSGTGLTVASGAHLSTSFTGTGDVAAYTETPLTNQAGGTVTIGAPDTRQDESTLTTNAGTLQVVNGGHLTMSSGGTLTSTGTLGVTVNGTVGTGGISGPGVTITGSTLAVTTVGSQPTASTMFTPIGGPVTGTFTNLSFGPNAYAVTYPSSAVVLTAENPFTTSPTALSPAENVQLTTPQVATIANANDDTTATWSGTVNYGDGSGPQTATVNITGATGTVVGPSHTYTTPGTYTVTTSVSNTNGTTQTTSESVTVAGPTITGFSKTSIKQGLTLTTVVSGTGFDSHDVVTVSNAGVTVRSAKLSKTSKKHPIPTLKLKLKASKTATLGPFNVTITDSSNGANTTAIGAITVKS